MEAYYDSDEDVYWGPVTLKERKKDLLRPVLVDSIERRQTISFNPSFGADTSKRAQELVQMDETKSPKPRRSSYPKTDDAEPGFIEKLAQVLDVTTDASSYHTAVDYIKSAETSVAPSNTLDDVESASDIFESAPSSVLLENIHCTLYNSVQFQTYKESANFVETEEVISVSDSDDEVDLSSDCHVEVLSPQHPKVDINHEVILSRHVKEEDMFDRSAGALAIDHLVSVSDNEGDANATSYGRLDTLPMQEVLPGVSHGQDRSSVSDADQLLSDNSLHDVSTSSSASGYESDTLGRRNIPRPPPEIRIHDCTNTETNRLTNVLGNLDIIGEVGEFDSSRKFEIFSSSKTVHDTASVREESSETSAVHFDDTLEEMERLLNQGLNYTMEEKKPLAGNDVIEQKPKKKEILTPARTIPNPIKSTKKPTPFKSPVSFNTPSTLPKINRNKFRNIQSPVGTYIKNAGTTPLTQKVTPSKELNQIPIRINGKANQENANPLQEFPGVRYKPAKQRLVTKAEFKLPSCINSLIPVKTAVTKHTGRIGRTTKTTSLSDGDLTVTGDNTMNMTDDISILVSKNALIS